MRRAATPRPLGRLGASCFEPSANIGKISETGKRRTPNGEETEENRGGFLTFPNVKKYDKPRRANLENLQKFNTPDGVKRSAAPRRAEPGTRTAHGARQGRRRRGTRGARRGNRRREEPRPAPRATYRRRTAKGDGRRARHGRGRGRGRRGAAERFTIVNCHARTLATLRRTAFYNCT